MDTPVLSHYLKIWADKWGCLGETKGGTVALNYEYFIVTSNFSIDILFAASPLVTIQAIRRRFRVIHFDGMPGLYKDESEQVISYN